MSAWAVFGDGAWGRALARRLAAADHTVLLVGLAASRRKLPAGVTHTTDGPTALATCERLVFALPAAEVEQGLRALAPHCKGHHRALTTARGLTTDNHRRASEAVQALTCIRQVAVLAGAADAQALDKNQPAALVVGSPFGTWADEIQDSLVGKHLRIYTNPDAVGVELSNALAAVLAVAMGAARELAVGAATEATALTRAVAEMDRVVQGLGGRANTAHGLAGLGALTTYIFEGGGAGFQAGQAIARGETEGLADRHPELVEAATTLAARAAKQRLRAPMLGAVLGLLKGEVAASSALDALMQRAARAE
ncbi:MAG: hypothetical protein KC613_17900 [Myxococcales bacterium]|nr:hypothetical protein [Myxococcales bacterium]